MSTRRTFGSLNAGDVLREVTVDDAGYKFTGKVQSVWHRANHKGESVTLLTLDIVGGEVKLTRPSLTELDAGTDTEGGTA